MAATTIVDHGQVFEDQYHVCLINSLCGEILALTGRAVPAAVQKNLILSMQPRPGHYIDPLNGTESVRTLAPVVRDEVVALCLRMGVDLDIYTSWKPTPVARVQNSGSTHRICIQLLANSHWVGRRGADVTAVARPSPMSAPAAAGAVGAPAAAGAAGAAGAAVAFPGHQVNAPAPTRVHASA